MSKVSTWKVSFIHGQSAEVWQVVTPASGYVDAKNIFRKMFPELKLILRVDPA